VMVHLRKILVEKKAIEPEVFRKWAVDKEHGFLQGYLTAIIKFRVRFGKISIPTVTRITSQLRKRGRKKLEVDSLIPSCIMCNMREHFPFLDPVTPLELDDRLYRYSGLHSNSKSFPSDMKEFIFYLIHYLLPPLEKLFEYRYSSIWIRHFVECPLNQDWSIKEYPQIQATYFFDEECGFYAVTYKEDNKGKRTWFSHNRPLSRNHEIENRYFSVQVGHSPFCEAVKVGGAFPGRHNVAGLIPIEEIEKYEIKLLSPDREHLIINNNKPISSSSWIFFTNLINKSFHPEK